jgi:hypothetical protein
MKKTVLVSLFLGAAIAGSAAIDASPANAGGRYCNFCGNGSNGGFPRPPKPQLKPPVIVQPPKIIVIVPPKPVYFYKPAPKYYRSWGR